MDISVCICIDYSHLALYIHVYCTEIKFYYDDHYNFFIMTIIIIITVVYKYYQEKCQYLVLDMCTL